MKNRIGLLLWILLMIAVYACKSDKETSAKSSTRIESPIMEVDETPDNNESITANKTGTKVDDKKNSSTMFGKKGSMKENGKYCESGYGDSRSKETSSPWVY